MSVDPKKLADGTPVIYVAFGGRLHTMKLVDAAVPINDALVGLGVELQSVATQLGELQIEVGATPMPGPFDNLNFGAGAAPLPPVTLNATTPGYSVIIPPTFTPAPTSGLDNAFFNIQTGVEQSVQVACAGLITLDNTVVNSKIAIMNFNANTAVVVLQTLYPLPGSVLVGEYYQYPLYVSAGSCNEFLISLNSNDNVGAIGTTNLDSLTALNPKVTRPPLAAYLELTGNDGNIISNAQWVGAADYNMVVQFPADYQYQQVTNLYIVWNLTNTNGNTPQQGFVLTEIPQGGDYTGQMVVDLSSVLGNLDFATDGSYHFFGYAYVINQTSGGSSKQFTYTISAT